MYNNDFEKFPSGDIENTNERFVPEEQDFSKAFESGVPEFAGSTTAYSDENMIKPEELPATQGNSIGEESTNYDDGLAGAAAIINYGLDAAAREIGVERTVQLIKNFDLASSEDPIKDLYEYLGIDTTDERQSVMLEAKATKPQIAGFYEESDMPATLQRSKEGAIKAITDMKELISEVESADPRYAELRAKAHSAGKGYFEYAVKDFGTRGLTELFSVLMEQKEAQENTENTPEDDSMVHDNDNKDGRQAIERDSSGGIGVWR